jgi:hypothetical protein
MQKYRMRRSSVVSAEACCKAGPSSNLGSASHGWRLPLLSEDAVRIQEDGPRRMVKNERSVIVLYE